MMADQDWMTTGVYLVGLVSLVLLMSALATRATRARPGGHSKVSTGGSK